MWITHRDAEFSKSALYTFKKTFNAGSGAAATVRISAETRFKLYVNGALVSHGPQKAADKEKFYSVLDISKHLIEGENLIEVQVLQLPADDDLSAPPVIYALFRSGNMLLWAHISVNEEGKITEFETDESWLCAKNEAVSFRRPTEGVSASLSESVDMSRSRLEFTPAVSVMPAMGDFSHHINYGCTNRFYLKKRIIPELFLKEGSFVSEKDGVYDAGVLKFGYIRARIKGTGRVRLTYAESFGRSDNKADREDSSLGLYGDTDEIFAVGDCEFLPFWYRCFRFVRVETEGSARLEGIDFIETGYPFEFESDYDFGSPEDNALWDISVRTLRLCAHETYEDCPYYEQLQYQMDTSLQMLFTYCLTDDDALARQAIRAYAASQREDGLMTSRYPALEIQYIPTFSLFFIFMLHCHLVRFGDKEYIRSYLDNAEGVLKWFRAQRDENGLIRRTHFWNFIDWASTWGADAGSPLPPSSEPVVHHGLMVSYASRLLAEIYEALGSKERASELMREAKYLNEASKRAFFKDGIYYDDIRHTKKSEHAEVWAVLSGAMDPELGRAALTEARGWQTRSTFAFAYFLFRALEICGIYEYSEDIMQKLRGLPALNCTTVPETPEYPRSECHAWGSIAIYEFTHTLLGVKADSRTPYIEISPRIPEGRSAEGTVFTHLGKVRVRVENKNGLSISVTAPKGVHFRFPEGAEYTVKSV